MTRNPLSALAVVTVAVAVGAAPSPDDRNGATWYTRAVESVPTVTDAEWDLLDTYRAHPSGPPSAQLREILSRFNRSMDLVGRGSQLAYSDYGLDYSQGFSLELPHLGQLRQLGRVMSVDALVKMHDGHTADAAARVAGLYRLGGHVGQDRIVISSLVGQVIWGAGDKTLQTMLDRGLVGPGEAMAVLAAAENLEGGDPFSYVDATMMEYDLVAESVEDLVDADGLVDFSQLEDVATADPGDPLTLTRQEVEVQLDGYADYIDEVVEVFVEADPERGPEALSALQAKLVAGEYGDIAQRLAPAIGRVFDRRMAAEARLAERVKTLEGLAAGELDFRTQANAAVWYLRAIELLHREPADAFAALRSGEPAAPPGEVEDDASTSAGHEDVVDLLRDASVMTRCDFTFAHDPAARPTLAAPYAVGLRDLLTLVLAEVRDRDDAGDRETLMDRLRIGWSMAKHLEGDPMFTTAITSHEAFNSLVALSVEFTASDALTPQQHAELSSLARRFGRTDPFGYTAAIIKARADIRFPIHDGTMLVEPLGRKLLAELDETVKSFNGDLLIYLAAILDTFRTSGDGDTDTHSAALEPLAGILDLEALDTARSQTADVLPMMSFEVSGLPQREIPDIGSIERRRRDARRDLRRGVRSLQPPATD